MKKKNSILMPFAKYSLGIILLLYLHRANGQKHMMQYHFRPTLDSVLDTMFTQEEINKSDMILAVAGYDSINVFISKKYCVSITYSTNTRVHNVYNRKSRIIQTHTKYGDHESYGEDSVMYYLHKDKELRSKAKLLKDTLQIKDFPGKHKSIHNKKCYLSTQPAYGWLSIQPDSFWLTNDDLPTIFAKGFGYLSKGIPLEYVINNGVISVRITSTKRHSTYTFEDVCIINQGNAIVRQHQTQKEIEDVDKFVSDFKVRLP